MLAAPSRTTGGVALLVAGGNRVPTMRGLYQAMMGLRDIKILGAWRALDLHFLGHSTVRVKLAGRAAALRRVVSAGCRCLAAC